ncbi:MAG TPA: hypothetical protein PLX84_10730 [Acidiphilium sp.]|nr:hypothetical protein [Acidiphilium sp.]
MIEAKDCAVNPQREFYPSFSEIKRIYVDFFKIQYSGGALRPEAIHPRAERCRNVTVVRFGAKMAFFYNFMTVIFKTFCRSRSRLVGRGVHNREVMTSGISAEVRHARRLTHGSSGRLAMRSFPGFVLSCDGVCLRRQSLPARAPPGTRLGTTLRGDGFGQPALVPDFFN